MRRFGWIGSFAALCLMLSVLIGGTAPLGRVMLTLGAPRLAVPLLNDPGWKGVAHYRAGQYARAAEEFRQAGAVLNLGNAEVHRAHYAAALEAYDVARLAGDARGSANFDLVAAFYAGLALDPETPIAWFTDKDGSDGDIVKSSIAQGNARAAGTGDGATNTGALLGLPELASHGTREIRKVFDDQFMVANRRWLVTLQDVPGEYLVERIKFEYKQRKKDGVAQPEPEDRQ